jgi:ABC-2 type transport system permease protein
MLLPLLASVVLAVAAGESLRSGITLLAIYLLYLCIWGLLSLLVSALVPRRSSVLALLTGLWLALTLLLPSLATSYTARALPIAGQIETDLTMLAHLREHGDGHNAQDPAFAQLRSELLQRYNVERVEDLPVNWRGVVAEYSEAQLSETLNAYAETRMQQEAAQAALLTRQGWLTPVLATAAASRAISGTDLANHQRFLREAERVRLEFVQGLNRVHAEVLSYDDDMNRNQDAEAGRRARVSADNWRVLEEFRFEPSSAEQRLALVATPLLALIVWFAALTGASMWAGGRLKP